MDGNIVTYKEVKREAFDSVEKCVYGLALEKTKCTKKCCKKSQKFLRSIRTKKQKGETSP